MILDSGAGNVAGAHVKIKSHHSFRQGYYGLLWKWMKVNNRHSGLNVKYNDVYKTVWKDSGCSRTYIYFSLPLAGGNFNVDKREKGPVG